MRFPAAGRASSAVPPLSAYGHLLTIYLVWGAAYLAVKICIAGTAAITVLQLQSARMWCAALLLGVVAMVRSGEVPRLSVSDIGTCMVSGLLMWVAGNGLATLASHHATSSFIVMALGAIPLWSCLFDLVIARSVPSRGVVLGLVLGLLGLFLVMAPALLDTRSAIIAPGHAGFVALVLVGAGASWSLGTIVQRPLMRRVQPEWAATFQMLAAALVLTVLAAAEAAPLPGPPDMQQVLAFGFLIVFASVIGLTSYIRVLRAFSPVVASTFAYVNPIIGVLLGSTILGEELAPVSLLGLVAVLASIFIVVKN